VITNQTGGQLHFIPLRTNSAQDPKDDNILQVNQSYHRRVDMLFTNPMKSVLWTWLWSGCFFLLPALCQALSRHYDVWDSAPTVTLASGVLVGTKTLLPSATAGGNKFLGVPFADSPPKRFSPPQDPRPWSKPLSVLTVKPACIQQWTCKRIEND
jgi:Carboxylesterase family